MMAPKRKLSEQSLPASDKKRRIAPFANTTVLQPSQANSNMQQADSRPPSITASATELDELATSRLLSLLPEIRAKIWSMLLPHGPVREISKSMADQVQVANAAMEELKKSLSLEGAEGDALDLESVEYYRLRGAIEKQRDNGRRPSDDVLAQFPRHYAPYRRFQIVDFFYFDSDTEGDAEADMDSNVEDSSTVVLVNRDLFAVCHQIRDELRRCLFENCQITFKLDIHRTRAHRRKTNIIKPVHESSFDVLSMARNLNITARATDIWTLKTILEKRSSIHRLNFTLITSVRRSSSPYFDKMVASLQPLKSIPVRDEVNIWLESMRESQDSGIQEALDDVEAAMLRAWLANSAS